MKEHKKGKMIEGLELEHLNAVREAWRSARMGMTVCMVSVYECGWDTLLGQYFDVVMPYVKKGLIYHRVEDTVKPELQIQVTDLDKLIIEMGMV